MINKKKKGFTLVELIGAMAILAIAMTGISLTFNTSSIMWKKARVSLDLVSANQSISQNIRAVGKEKVKGIYDNINAVNNSSGCYLFFNTYDEIKNIITATDYSGYTVSTSATPDFNECTNINIGKNKKYGALIKIRDVTETGSYYKLYELTITVWSLQESENSKSENTFYIGR